MTTCGRICTAVVVVAMAISYYGAYERGLWFMEAGPVLIGLPIALLTSRKFPLTSLTQVLMMVHALILLTGAHYSYAKVPLGFWLKERFDLKRNPFDRIGHLAQGFIPAILAREIMLRRTALQPGFRQSFLTTCVCLAISAFYELVEWAAAKALGQGADEFLATQGDQWDTQWDMFLALIGAIAAQLMFFRLHDRQLQKLRANAAKKVK